MSELRYPEDQMPVAAELPEQQQRFAELREEFLLDFGYNTARAYWGDLDDLLYWANKRDKDVLGLTQQDIRQYLALLRRRQYSSNTIRRRKTTFRAFYGHVVRTGDGSESPMEPNLSDVERRKDVGRNTARWLRPP